MATDPAYSLLYLYYLGNQASQLLLPSYLPSCLAEPSSTITNTQEIDGSSSHQSLHHFVYNHLASAAASQERIMVYEAVEAIALRSQVQRRNMSARSHEHQVKARENELIWGFVLWIISKVCPAF